MSIEDLRQTIPEYAKDLRLNLGTVLSQPELSKQQLWGTALACAHAAGNVDTLETIAEEAKQHLDETAYNAAQSAAAIMAMNNVYYRTLHLASNKEYGTLRAGLRMNVLRTHGSNPVDFELWCLAVSAINGCGACVDSHEKVVREKGLGADQVLAAFRIASVIHAVARVLDAETALG